jgi:hypothetical protein
VVQAGGKSIKLPVTGNGTGGSTAPPPKPETRTAAYTPAPSLRAGSGFYSYWNISDGNIKIPIDMSQVKAIRFTAEHGIIIEYRNGQTIEISDYQGGSFDIEPAPIPANGWDFSKYEYWGGSYGFNNTYSHSDLYGWLVVGIVHKNGVIIYDFRNEVERYYANNEINPEVWKKKVLGQVLRLSMLQTNETGLTAACSYLNQWGNMVKWNPFNGRGEIGLDTQYYFLDNDSNNFAPTVIKTTAEGIKMVATSKKDGKEYSHTFKGWNPPKYYIIIVKRGDHLVALRWRGLNEKKTYQFIHTILHAGYFCALYFSRHCDEGRNPGRRLCLDCFVPRNDGEGDCDE